MPSLVVFFHLLVSCLCAVVQAAEQSELTKEPVLSKERVVMSTNYGDIQIGFYPEVAPITVKYIIKLFQLGCYNTNYFFRVDKGFVAQIADVVNGRLVPLSPMQKRATETTIPLEVTPDVIHVEGSLSIGRHADPNSGGSSFSILYSRQQHLDMQYTIFGKVVSGMETVFKLDKLPTKTEGIFVMPVERITIHSTFLVYVDDPLDTAGSTMVLNRNDVAMTGALKQDSTRCDTSCPDMRYRVQDLESQLQSTREKCLPGNTP